MQYVYNTKSYRSKREALMWSLSAAGALAPIMLSYGLLGYPRSLYLVLLAGYMLLGLAVWSWWKRRGRDRFPLRPSADREE
ncbi:hypothetical protein [Candidatus Poriferisodalis sp.]|uniref:hypothetical protein n=1 Tax=Candidatus Poriferisodalis sp. TaxID=3101277 RepID=UPI003B0257CA